MQAIKAAGPAASSATSVCRMVCRSTGSNCSSRMCVYTVVPRRFASTRRS